MHKHKREQPYYPVRSHWDNLLAQNYPSAGNKKTQEAILSIISLSRKWKPLRVSVIDYAMLI